MTSKRNQYPVEKVSKGKEILLSAPRTFKGNIIRSDRFKFSFAYFDRKHELFNLGGVAENWLIDLMDCLQSVSSKTWIEVRQSMHDLHHVSWESANAKPPDDQHEYWQFRINKSKGRVIGFLFDGVFYVVWLDPHHNLTNSEGYGKAIPRKPALSTWELQEQELERLRQRIAFLEQQ